MKRSVLFSIALLFLIPAMLFACSTIVAGKKATKNGAVLFGHNEDDYGQRVVNAWYVPRVQHEAGSVVTLKRGGQVEQVPETWAYTWFQTNGLEFSDYYVNEWHVNVGSDACRSREDNPELTDGGIGYWLRRLVAERARTAREGVEIAGALLDRFGYASSGRTYVIADPNEAWFLSVVEGKHWVAQRVADDEVVFLPNQYIIRQVDFSDSKNFITSKDNVRDYAIKRGWYHPDSGKAFDFALAFTYIHGEKSQFAQRGYDTRQWAAQRLMTGRSVSIEEAKKNGLPFGVKPNRKLGVEDLQAVLRHHFEETPYAPVYNVRAVAAGDEAPADGALPTRIHVNPNMTSERTISTTTTVLSTVAELRSSMPSLLKTCLWTASGRPDCNIFVPWYPATSFIPAGYENTPGINDPHVALKHHFDPLPGTLDYDADSAWWTFNELENLVDLHFQRNIETVQSVWQEYESMLFKLQPEIEATAKTLLDKDDALAGAWLQQYMTGWTATAVQEARLLNKLLKGQMYH